MNYTDLALTWLACSAAPHDLVLVTKDGSLEAHCSLFLPLSPNLKDLVEASSCCGPAQVFFPEVSRNSMGAVKDLIYKGFCLIEKDGTNIPEIIDLLGVLGKNLDKSSQNNSQIVALPSPSHQEVATPFVCEQCPKKFRSKQHLEMHMVVHTGEMRFSCEQCPKKFRLKQHLEMHLAAHDGDLPFCNTCHKTFHRKSALKKHRKIHRMQVPIANFKRETRKASFFGEIDAPHKEKFTKDGLEQGTNHRRFVSDSEASVTSMKKDNMQDESSKQPSEDFQKEASEKVEPNNNAEPSPADVKNHMNRCESSDKNNNLQGSRAAAATTLEDEFVSDEGTNLKMKPKKVISTKDRHNFFNFFNVKLKEKSEQDKQGKKKRGGQGNT